MIYVGTSGWQYRSWRGRFYPQRLAQRGWLAHYAAAFRVVEVNNTFYRLPERATFAAWAAQVPDEFRFVVKVSRYLTHMKRLADPEPAVARLLAATAGLGAKQGPFLLQLSPLQAVDAGRLDAALGAFPPDARVAVEYRHDSWAVPEIRRVLERRGAALCLADRRGPVTPPWRTARWGYVRFHAGSAAPAGCYGPRALAAWARRIVELWPASADVFVFFNNDGHGCAVRDAIVLARALARQGRATTPVPPLAAAPVG
jgi:uncharacterized protein YecE (DUF72 family)